jgi:hypothetical protein
MTQKMATSVFPSGEKVTVRWKLVGLFLEGKAATCYRRKFFARRKNADGHTSLPHATENYNRKTKKPWPNGLTLANAIPHYTPKGSFIQKLSKTRDYTHCVTLCTNGSSVSCHVDCETCHAILPGKLLTPRQNLDLCQRDLVIHLRKAVPWRCQCNSSARYGPFLFVQLLSSEPVHAGFERFNVWEPPQVAWWKCGCSCEEFGGDIAANVVHVLALHRLWKKGETDIRNPTSRFGGNVEFWGGFGFRCVRVVEQQCYSASVWFM